MPGATYKLLAHSACKSEPLITELGNSKPVRLRKGCREFPHTTGDAVGAGVVAKELKLNKSTSEPPSSLSVTATKGNGRTQDCNSSTVPMSNSRSSYKLGVVNSVVAVTIVAPLSPIKAD